MPKISFSKPRPSLDVEVGANLMQSLLAGGAPVASVLPRRWGCGKCKITIVSAEAGALSAESDLEKFLRDRHSIPAGVRVSCQTSVLGNITVDASYW